MSSVRAGEKSSLLPQRPGKENMRKLQETLSTARKVPETPFRLFLHGLNMANENTCLPEVNKKLHVECSTKQLPHCKPLMFLPPPPPSLFPVINKIHPLTFRKIEKDCVFLQDLKTIHFKFYKIYCHWKITI